MGANIFLSLTTYLIRSRYLPIRLFLSKDERFKYNTWYIPLQDSTYMNIASAIALLILGIFFLNHVHAR